jgi:hypothetical protein
MSSASNQKPVSHTCRRIIKGPPCMRILKLLWNVVFGYWKIEVSPLKTDVIKIIKKEWLQRSFQLFIGFLSFLNQLIDLLSPYFPISLLLFVIPPIPHDKHKMLPSPCINSSSSDNNPQHSSWLDGARNHSLEEDKDHKNWRYPT